MIAYSEVGSIADTTFNEGLAIYFRELAHLTKNYEEEPIEDIIINGNDTPSTYLHIGGEDNGKHSFTRYQQVAKLLHHNWGWGGDSDGWYYNLQISRQRDGSQYNFDYYRTIYTQIKPK